MWRPKQKPLEDRDQSCQKLPSTERVQSSQRFSPVSNLFGSVVAVGTTITGRPPHRSVQARLRIRLLPWMASGKACIGVGMQNAGLRNPPRQQRGETIPPHLCPLTATD